MNRSVFRIFAIGCFVCVLATAGRCDEILTWRACVNYAFKHNPDLQSSMELINKNKAAEGIARGGYLPKIDANIGLTTSISDDKTINSLSDRARQIFSTPYTNNSTETVTNPLTYGVSGSQLIFDGMKTVYDIKAARSNTEDAKYQYEIKSALVRFNLRSAYVKLLKWQEAVKIYNEIVERRKKNYNLVKMRYNAGREHKGSLMDAEANYTDAMYNLHQVERSISVAQRSLLKAMGMYAYKKIRVEGALETRVEERDKPDFDDIVRSHPQVLDIMKQNEAALYNEKSKVAGFLPTISAIGSFDQSLPLFNSGTRTTSTNYKVGIKATLPLFDGASNYYNLKKAESETKKLKADELSSRDQVVSNLEQYWNDWQNAIDYVSVQRKFLEAAKERAKIAEGEYFLGLLVFDNWIIIENQLAQSKQSHLEAQANQLLAEAQWIQAKGETLAYDK